MCYTIAALECSGVMFPTRILTINLINPARKWALEMFKISRRAMHLTRHELGDEISMPLAAALDKAVQQLEKSYIREHDEI